MNRLELSFADQDDDEGGVYRGIAIQVDGRDFLESIRKFEKTFAEREGHPDLAGDYSWLDARHTSAETFLGEASREYGSNEAKIALMGCPCGIVSCWPLICDIRVSDTEVVWADFEQPFRSTNAAAGHWDYSDFGPFLFERQAYETAISVLLV